MNDLELWDAFSQAALPEKEWTHRAHLRMAWLFSSRYPLDEAHVLIRVGIIRLNATHGLVETAARGYHETITRVWLVLMRAMMKEVPSPSSLDFLEVCTERLGRDALLRHYSRERLGSLEARARFVEPDLLPLPSVE
jgi:hypothetical protein